MALDWSQLPNDLLILISKRLDNEIDLIHFRSICSNWRSSSIPYHHTNTLPSFKLPLLEYPDEESSDSDNFNDPNFPFCCLSKHSIYLIKPPQQQQHQQPPLRPWLIRVTQNPSGKTKLYNSLLFPARQPSPYPFELDMNKLSVLHLGTNFIVEPLRCYHGYKYPKKIVSVTPLILTVLLDNNQLVEFHWKDGRWTEIPEKSLLSIGDFCFFKGQIFPVKARDSETAAVGTDVFNREGVVFLVESEGELLRVHISYVFKIRVFRFDEMLNEWVQLTSLGDKVLFLGKGCSFSVHASDLCASKGNCVIFMADVFDHNSENNMYVFDLDIGRISFLIDYPEYHNLFWPPPKWIVKSCMSKTKTRKSKLSSIRRFLVKRFQKLHV